MLATENCPDVQCEFLQHFENVKDCSWHDTEGVSYPEEYSRWFYQKELAGNVQNTCVPLQIIAPRNGSVFFYDSSLPDNVQNLTVEVIGGKGKNLCVKNGEDTFIIERPFSFKLPLSPGNHKITVSCEDEVCDVFFQCKK